MLKRDKEKVTKKMREEYELLKTKIENEKKVVIKQNNELKLLMLKVLFQSNQYENEENVRLSYINVLK